MITFQEVAERDCRNRCQLIDSLLRGDGKIVSYEVDVKKLKSDKAIKETLGVNNRRILQVIKKC